MIAIIANSHAGSAGQLPDLRHAIANRADIVLYETQTAGEATAVAEEALRAGAEMIVAAGGDGAINAVVNGLAADFAGTTLGIIPLGTGNDLARTLALPLEPLEALALLIGGTARPIDVIQLDCANRMIYGLNMAIGGFTGQMNEMMTEELKATWGPLAYLMGAVKTLPQLTGYHTDTSGTAGRTNTTSCSTSPLPTAARLAVACKLPPSPIRRTVGSMWSSCATNRL
jgi:diacylglycerol kinase (ATP)